MFSGRVSGLLLFTLLATVACTEGYSGENPEPPLILRGTSPLPSQDTTRIEKISGDGALDALVAEYRVVGEFDTSQIAGKNTRWWVVIPPIQSTAGYRLQVSVGTVSAQACLAPPDGPAAMMLTASAFLVALPEQVSAVNWDGACS